MRAGCEGPGLGARHAGPIFGVGPAAAESGSVGAGRDGPGLGMRHDDPAPEGVGWVGVG